MECLYGSMICVDPVSDDIDGPSFVGTPVLLVVVVVVVKGQAMEAMIFA